MAPEARTDSNRRLYTEAQIRAFIGLRHALAESSRQQRQYPTKLLYLTKLHKAAKTDKSLAF